MAGAEEEEEEEEAVEAVVAGVVVAEVEVEVDRVGAVAEVDREVAVAG